MHVGGDFLPESLNPLVRHTEGAGKIVIEIRQEHFRNRMDPDTEIDILSGNFPGWVVSGKCHPQRPFLTGAGAGQLVFESGYHGV